MGYGAEPRPPSHIPHFTPHIILYFVFCILHFYNAALPRTRAPVHPRTVHPPRFARPYAFFIALITLTRPGLLP